MASQLNQTMKGESGRERKRGVAAEIHRQRKTHTHIHRGRDRQREKDRDRERRQRQREEAEKKTERTNLGPRGQETAGAKMAI